MALESVKIDQASTEEISQVLRRCMLKVGMRANNLPSNMESVILYEHLVTFFGKMGLDELRLAFDLATSGQIEVPETFENFSCQYLSKVLNAYKKWASKTYWDNRNIIEAPKKEEQKIYTDEEILNQRRAEIEHAFQAMRSKHYPLLHSYFKEVLEKDGLLKEGETIADFFVRKLNNQVENIYKKEA